MEIVPEGIKKSTWNKVLDYIAMSDEPPPYLLMDKEVIREKVGQIGKTIRTRRFFMRSRRIRISKSAGFLAEQGSGLRSRRKGTAYPRRDWRGSERIITSNPMKTFRFMEEAVAYGVNYFAYDTKPEVDKMARYAPGPMCMSAWWFRTKAANGR